MTKDNQMVSLGILKSIQKESISNRIVCLVLINQAEVVPARCSYEQPQLKPVRLLHMSKDCRISPLNCQLCMSVLHKVLNVCINQCSYGNTLNID